MAEQEVYLQEMDSTVTAMDGDALLSPQTLRRIVAAVMREVEAREGHRVRVRSEQYIEGGLGDDTRGNWG